MWGNRGPVYTGNSMDGWELLENSAYGDQSDTLQIHGASNSWAGNVGFADGHVSFENEPDPEAVTFQDKSGQDPITYQDNIFFDETNEGSGGSGDAAAASRRNALLRIYKRGTPINSSYSASFNQAMNGTYVWVDGDS
jgi:prepilin-type processing-associated H-X9-DG protein